MNTSIAAENPCRRLSDREIAEGEHLYVLVFSEIRRAVWGGEPACLFDLAVGNALIGLPGAESKAYRYLNDLLLAGRSELMGDHLIWYDYTVCKRREIGWRPAPGVSRSQRFAILSGAECTAALMHYQGMSKGAAARWTVEYLEACGNVPCPSLRSLLENLTDDGELISRFDTMREPA